MTGDIQELFTPASHISHSNYTMFDNGRLVSLSNPESTVSSLTNFVHNQVRSLILDPAFPCVAARSAINNNTYRFAMYTRLASPEATEGLREDLATFIHEQPDMNSDFTTFITCFSDPVPVSEEHFESLLWQQLQALHLVDTCDWDPTVSSDPDDTKFSFSFSGRSFFVVGLHPGSSRWTRRFAWPTLVFNSHAQFERLRELNRFERFQKVIRKRDVDLQGNINPNLVNHGDRSEARQYSGRAIGEEWKCPFVKKQTA